MPRWESDTRVRLVQAAVELFSNQGYEVTTVNEIVEAAGLTKPTFFRHFGDKREVLFAGQEEHIQIMSAAVADAASDTPILDAAADGIKALTTRFAPDRHDYNVRLAKVIATSPDLQERWTYKRAALANALQGALVSRGFDEVSSGLAADITIRAYYEAHSEWLESSNKVSLTRLTSRKLEKARAGLHHLAKAETDHHEATSSQ